MLTGDCGMDLVEGVEGMSLGRSVAICSSCLILWDPPATSSRRKLILFSEVSFSVSSSLILSALLLSGLVPLLISILLVGDNPVALSGIKLMFRLESVDSVM